MRNVVEDVADPNGEPFALVIANPGAGYGEEVDAGRRAYHALRFQLSARLWKALAIDASYVMSATDGNYPGLHSPENGQADPNVSSQWDLVETLPNREGALPQDRTHVIKLDGSYTWRDVTLGARVRALSGTPIGALGRHATYGPGEVFLLPRGALGRTDFATSLDLHADYERALGHGLRLTVFADLLDAANAQSAFTVDQAYTTLSDVAPIVGGTYDDLLWAKERDTTVPIKRNPHFRHPASRYAPLSLQLGARLTF